MQRILFVLVALLLATVPAPAQKKGQKPPDPGTVFHVSESKPTHVTCDIEFRDPKDERWPNFFYGKPLGAGTFTWDPKQPKINLVLNCSNQVQKNGDQSRRVLGQRLVDGKTPTVKVAIDKMGAPTTEKVTTTDARGKTSTKVVEYATTEAVVEFDGKKTKVEGKTTFRWNRAKNAEKPEAVYLELSFLMKASDLGLTDFIGAIECRAGVTAYLALPEGKKGKK